MSANGATFLPVAENIISYLANLLGLAPQPVVDQAVRSICHAGDFLCEMTDEKWQLPLQLSEYIAKTEEVTGISKYYSGPVILAGVGIIGARHLYNKYNAKTAYDLIINIIEKEFGDILIAKIIFKTFKKAIEDAIDAQVNEFLDKYKLTASALSQQDIANHRKTVSEQIIGQLMPTLLKDLKANKEALLAQASTVKSTEKDVNNFVSPGLQLDGATADNPGVQLHKMVAKNFLPNHYKAVKARKAMI